MSGLRLVHRIDNIHPFLHVVKRHALPVRTQSKNPTGVLRMSSFTPFYLLMLFRGSLEPL